VGSLVEDGQHPWQGVKMKASSGNWDVKCPDKLKELFPRRTRYYFKVGIDRKFLFVPTTSLS
jgi:hypothetical protein